MKGRLNLYSRTEIVERLSRLLYFAKSDDSHSMSSCFSSLVEFLYGDLSFIPTDSDHSDEEEPEL